MVTKASSRRDRSIQPRNFQMWVRWWRTVSLTEHQPLKNIKKVKNKLTDPEVNTKHKIFGNLTCILISQGGGAPSGIPRASFSSCDSMPGFISLNFTYIPGKKIQCEFQIKLHYPGKKMYFIKNQDPGSFKIIN